jgi:hypothetical protein
MLSAALSCGNTSNLMVRRRECAVSNHEAHAVASSFETPRFARLLRMRREAFTAP